MGVMGIKTGTKSWSDAQQESSLKMDNRSNLTSKELEALGGGNIGEVLNKIADPNWVDPSKKIRAVGSDKLDKDAFMKLMLAQMKNQDPTNPLKSHEMAAQLAQFSSLEQLQNMNTSLDEIKGGQKPQEIYQALNFIGKAVAGDSSKLVRAKGDRDHTFNFTLPEDVKTADITVKNHNGETIRKVTLRDMKRGENLWRWNGEGENGLPSPAGEYRFSIEAKTAHGSKVAVKTDFDGIITGVNYTSDGPVLLVGDQSVKLKDVRKIVDPQILKNDQKSEKSTSDELKNAAKSAENERKGAPEAEEVKPVGNVMTGVAMAPDMMDKLQKEMSLK